MSANLPAERRQQRGLLGRVTGAVTERVVDTIDPDLVLEHVDLDALLDRIDVNRLLDRIDPDRLLDRIDVQRLLARIDLDTLLAGVDIGALLDKVDLETVVRRSGIPDIVAESTGAVAGSALDVARRQLAGLDFLVDRVVDRALRRDPANRVEAPVLLRGPQA